MLLWSDFFFFLIKPSNPREYFITRTSPHRSSKRRRIVSCSFQRCETKNTIKRQCKVTGKIENVIKKESFNLSVVLHKKNKKSLRK